MGACWILLSFECVAQGLLQGLLFSLLWFNTWQEATWGREGLFSLFEEYVPSWWEQKAWPQTCAAASYTVSAVRKRWAGRKSDRAIQLQGLSPVAHVLRDSPPNDSSVSKSSAHDKQPNVQIHGPAAVSSHPSTAVSLRKIPQNDPHTVAVETFASRFQYNCEFLWIVTRRRWNQREPPEDSQKGWLKERVTVLFLMLSTLNSLNPCPRKRSFLISKQQDTVPPALGIATLPGAVSLCALSLGLNMLYNFVSPLSGLWVPQTSCVLHEVWLPIEQRRQEQFRVITVEKHEVCCCQSFYWQVEKQGLSSLFVERGSF